MSKPDKRNVFHLVGQHWTSHPKDYMGTCGDWWPFDDSNDDSSRRVHDLYDQSLESVEFPDGSWGDVCTNRDAAGEYYEFTRHRVPKAVWLEVSLQETEDSLGIDFGDPRGGWSIVVNELQDHPSVLGTQARLNRHRLFSSEEELRAYLDFRQDFEETLGLETLADHYQAMWIRVVAYEDSSLE